VHDMDKAYADVWKGLSVADGEAADVLIIGVPFEGGAGGAGGASLGPDRVRELSRRSKKITWRGRDFSHLRLRDAGNVPTQRFDLSATVAGVRKIYEDVFRSVDVPVLTFGGDHSVTYPIVAAAAEAGTGRLGLIWFDAHPDVLDFYQGASVSHGSPLRRLLDDGAVVPEDVVLVGTRAYDPGEPEYLARMGVAEVRSADFADDHASAVARFRQFVADLAGRVDRIYVTVDIDVIDASQVPGTGTPVAGGITTSTLLTLLELVPEPVVAYDVVEFAPAHDVGGMTGLAVISITTEILARIAVRKG
jgi:agmatinase